MTERQPQGELSDTRERTSELDALQRRFTQRWVAGVVIGFVLVAVNWIGYRMVSQAVLDEGISEQSVAALTQLREVNAALTLVAVLVLGALAAFVFRPLGRMLRQETGTVARIEAEQARETAASRFDAEVHEALEMAGDEQGIAALVRHVLLLEVPEQPAELLLADSSDAHLTVRAENPAAGRAGCDVSSPFDCPAVRQARALTFPTSNAVNACPHLRDREGGPRSGHCVPLAFMGRSMGVMHLTGEDGEPLDDEAATRMASLAGQVGAHLGTVRAFATAQLQASTDSLTGLPNRRAVEDELSRRLAEGETFSVALADLDNFKLLNDTYGHDAGDRALRLFADTVRRSLRTEDLFARWGGEEFVIAIPGLHRDAAVAILDRARLALVDACVRAESPPVTASFGLVDTSVDRAVDVLLRRADEGLAEAKRAGKDQVHLGPIHADAAAEPFETRVETLEPLSAASRRES